MGSPVLLFFWRTGVWTDKAKAPYWANARRVCFEGTDRVAPTQRYGIAAGGENATPAAELAYTADTRNRYYSSLLDVPAPVSQENLSVYGVSTTPTLVHSTALGSRLLSPRSPFL